MLHTASRSALPRHYVRVLDTLPLHLTPELLSRGLDGSLLSICLGSFICIGKTIKDFPMRIKQPLPGGRLYETYRCRRVPLFIEVTPFAADFELLKKILYYWRRCMHIPAGHAFPRCSPADSTIYLQHKNTWESIDAAIFAASKMTGEDTHTHASWA